MAAPSASLPDQLEQLDKVRKLVLGDAAYYPQIVQGVLPIIGSNARLELRRWGADFLAETFASPSFPSEQKAPLSLKVLETLKGMLNPAEEDAAVRKSAVQAAASIYPLVFKHITATPSDVAAWEQMTAIKSSILAMWDTAAGGIRVCCIKFAQRVIQVQTSGPVVDPRHVDPNDISLGLVPRDHPLMPPPRLEAEASGLLDRLLNVFHENISDAVLVDATLNCLAALIRSRPSISNKIINAILNFNPLKQANSPMTPKSRVLIRSMERTTRALLVHVNKHNMGGPLAGRIHQYIDRLTRSRSEIFDEMSRKRGAPVEPTDGLDHAKRARLGANGPELSQSQQQVPPLPAGPTSYAQLYTVANEAALASFDVKQLPADIVTQIAVSCLLRVNEKRLNEVIDGVRQRYMSLERPGGAAQSTGLAATDTIMEDEDDDDYEPDFTPAEDDEQILNKLDAAPPEPEQPPPALGPFSIPQPLPLSFEEAAHIGQGTISRVLGVMSMLEQQPPPAGKPPRRGINRLAASNFDREAWTTILIRLGTRASAGLEEPDDSPYIKEEDGGKKLVANPATSLSNYIRETLYVHIIEDFRARINTAISWLNEEWYNDKIQAQARPATPSSPSPPQLNNYDKWAVRILDGILPYLDAKDKVLIRFLSEIPALSPQLVAKVKSLARDPERVALAVNALHYLALLRPPVRELCLDALEDLWRNYDDARSSAAKVLAKWRPSLLAPPPPSEPVKKNGGGVAESGTEFVLRGSGAASPPAAVVPAVINGNGTNGVPVSAAS